MTAAIITVEGLSHRYSGVPAVKDVSFEVAAGEIFGLLGPNGAGKTSLMKALVGVKPAEGELRVLGLDPVRQRTTLLQQLAYIREWGGSFVVAVPQLEIVPA